MHSRTKRGQGTDRKSNAFDRKIALRVRQAHTMRRSANVSFRSVRSPRYPWTGLESKRTTRVS